jgi:hypothetical protein
VRTIGQAHGVNDIHRHNRRGEKASATAFHAGTLGEGMRAAIAAVRADYKEMIAAWRAFDDGYAVVLVSADGRERVITATTLAASA